jgi:hypothetical protein
LIALAWAAISGAGYRFLRNQVGLEKDQIGASCTTNVILKLTKSCTRMVDGLASFQLCQWTRLDCLVRGLWLVCGHGNCQRRAHASTTAWTTISIQFKQQQQQQQQCKYNQFE